MESRIVALCDIPLLVKGSGIYKATFVQRQKLFSDHHLRMTALKTESFSLLQVSYCDRANLLATHRLLLQSPGRFVSLFKEKGNRDQRLQLIHRH